MYVHASTAATVAYLHGKVDVAGAADVRAFLHAAVAEAHGDVVVDLAEVELIDVTGLGVIVGAHRKASRDGHRLILRNVPGRMMRLLAMTQLYRVLYVEDMPQPAAA